MIDEDDLKDIPPHARAAIIAALNAVEEDRDPQEDYRQLMRLGQLLVGGIVPSPATIISAVAASVSLLRWVDKKRKRRNRRRRRRGASCGLGCIPCEQVGGAEVTLTPDQVALAQELKHASSEAKGEYVKQLIVQLMWTLDNRRELGLIWDVGPRSINRIAQRANAIILSQIEDPEDLRQKLKEQAMFVVTDCLQKKKHFVDKNGNIVGTPDPDHKAAFQGLQFIAKMAGVDKPKGEEERTGKYSRNNVAELLDIAQKKLLPERQVLESLDIQTEGESADEEEIEADKVAVPNPDRRRDSEERIRGGNTRRDRDPTGRGRGLSQEGRET